MCRSWQSAAIEEFYNKVILTNQYTKIVQEALQQEKDLVPRIAYGECAKVLKIVDHSTESEVQFTQEQLDSLLQLLPQLKQIDLTSTKAKSLNYLGFLENILKNNSDTKA